MSKVLTNNQYYSQIANIIREQNGTSNTYTPPQMVSALKDLFYEEVEGVPPITFQGIGEDLLDYRIDGASGGVGDLITDTSDANYNKYKVPVTIRKNIFNENSELNTNGTLGLDEGVYPFSVGNNRRTFFFNAKANTTYTFLCSSEGDRFVVCEYNRIVNPANYSVSNRLSADRLIYSQSSGLLRYSFTTSNNAKMIAIYYSLNTLPQDIQIFEENATTTNIYLNNAIEEGESISLSNTNINIPTIRGTNILTVDTTVQPSKVYVKVRKESSHEAQIRQLYESVSAELTQYKAQYGELGGE